MEYFSFNNLKQSVYLNQTCHTLGLVLEIKEKWNNKGNREIKVMLQSLLFIIILTCSFIQSFLFICKSAFLFGSLSHSFIYSSSLVGSLSILKILGGTFLP